MRFLLKRLAMCSRCRAPCQEACECIFFVFFWKIKSGTCCEHAFEFESLTFLDSSRFPSGFVLDISWPGKGGG